MIKSELINEETKSYIHAYPFLGKYEDPDDNSLYFIVLFYKYEEGVIIYSTDPDYKIGYLSDTWCMPDFITLNSSETIQLSNK